MLVIPALWMLLVRAVSLRSQYIAMDERAVRFHFSRGFTFHTITVSRERIVRIEMVQTVFQRRITSATCFWCATAHGRNGIS